MNDQSQPLELKELYRTLITGSHILHYHGVLDAYGHLSVRHPTDPSLFIMARYVAPGTIRSPSDLVQYHVINAEPIDPDSPKGYSERHIHSEIYKKFSGVQSVIHSHAESVVPFSINGVPLRPCYHMAGFLGLGGQVPVFEIEPFWKPDDIPDMLVRNSHLGAGLAATFGLPPTSDGMPRHAAALMRGHGFSVVGDSIHESVLRAVYTMKNASIQSMAIMTQFAAAAQPVTGASQAASRSEIRYLDQRESEAATNMTKWSRLRPWGLWEKEVEAAGMYVNEA